MRREERVTVQGPVKEQQPDGMSHGGGTSLLPMHASLGGGGVEACVEGCAEGAESGVAQKHVFSLEWGVVDDWSLHCRNGGPSWGKCGEEQHWCGLGQGDFGRCRPPPGGGGGGFHWVPPGL